jgi:hypothetical protein
MDKEVKRSTVYIAIEIINDGYSFERLWTCPREHEYTTPGEAAPCLFSKKYDNLYGGVRVLALCRDRLSPLLTVEEQSEVDQYIESRCQQKKRLVS